MKNTATATGTPPTGPPVVTPPSSTDTPVNQVTALAMVKRVVRIDDVNKDGLTSVGDRIWWAFDVTNTGTTTLTGVSVNDPLLVKVKIPVSCPPGSLAPGAKVTCTATRGYVITKADRNAGKVTNVATASVTPLICRCAPVTTPPSTTVTGVNTLVVTPITDGDGDVDGSQGPRSALASAGGPSLMAGGLALMLIVGGVLLVGFSRRRSVD